MTRREVLDAIEDCERRGEFDVHVDPIPEELIIPVTERYRYPGNRKPTQSIRYFLEKTLIVRPFTVYENKRVLKTRVVGRENLKGLDGAVLTCNHVAKFDCLAVKYGARGHRTYVVAANFNNMKGFLGEMMRAGDMMPMNTTRRGTLNFVSSAERVLTEKKSFLLFYPEAAMWWHYKKPRPYKDGAFSLAAKCGVPVVPQFITYRGSGEYDDEGIEKYYFTLHIMPPIYPKPELGRRENTGYLKSEAYAACCRVYEQEYGEPVKYPAGEHDRLP